MAVALRLTHAQFLAAVRGNYGCWMTSKMKEAAKTMKLFEDAKQGADKCDTQETAMINAWYIWSLTSEFRSVDTKSNGVCKTLAVEMGAAPDVDRESRTTAFVLTGKLREVMTAKQVPAVTVTDQTVAAYIDARRDLGGIVVIDAFGDGASVVRNGFSRKYGNQESTVMENIISVLQVAKRKQMPVFDVVMGANSTWSQLSDEYTPERYAIIKPFQPLFKGTDDYVKATLKTIKDTGVSYLVVVGWDAHQCVAAAIFGAEQIKPQPFIPGLVDFGFDVVTSRNLLGANVAGELESKWGWPHIGPPPK